MGGLDRLNRMHGIHQIFPFYSSTRPRSSIHHLFSQPQPQPTINFQRTNKEPIQSASDIASLLQSSHTQTRYTITMASAGDRPYDPYIPSDPAAGAQGANAAPGNQRTAALQAQIDDTVGVMREN